MIVKCEVCGGKGYCILKRSKVAFSCSICKGKGHIYVPENKMLCPKCKGGKYATVMLSEDVFIKTNCEECLGNGFIDKK